MSKPDFSQDALPWRWDPKWRTVWNSTGQGVCHGMHEQVGPLLAASAEMYALLKRLCSPHEQYEDVETDAHDLLKRIDADST